MRMFVEVSAVYLHREPVDFRKSINGLAVIVEANTTLSKNADPPSCLLIKLSSIRSLRILQRVSCR